MGNCHPSKKKNVDLGFASVDIGFSGWQFPMLPSRAVNIYIISYYYNISCSFVMMSCIFFFMIWCAFGIILWSFLMIWCAFVIMWFCCNVISISLIGYKNHNLAICVPWRRLNLTTCIFFFLVIRPTLTSCTPLPMAMWSFVKEQVMRYWIFYLSYKICISRQLNGYQKIPTMSNSNWKRYYQSFILTGKLVVMLYLYKQVL